MKKDLSKLLTLSLFLLCIAAPASARQSAQAQKPSPPPAAGFRADFLRQLGDAEEKLIALAEATPADKFTWRPAQGVRSVSEVFMHVAGGNYFLSTFLGVKPPEGVGRDIEKITDKAKVVETLRQSFAHARRAAEGVSDADLERQVKLFGNDSTFRGVLFLMATHAHEHLGQSIAYARMNGITPPWSARRQ